MVEVDSVTETKGQKEFVRTVGSECWQFADAEVKVLRPAPSVVLYQFSGRMPAELVPKIRAAADPLVRAGGTVALFFDTEKMSGYHPLFRAQMTKWHEEMNDSTRCFGVLVRSRVVQMGIAIASLVTRGKMVSYSDRSSFEAAVEKAVADEPD